MTNLYHQLTKAETEAVICGLILGTTTEGIAVDRPTEAVCDELPKLSSWGNTFVIEHSNPLLSVSEENFQIVSSSNALGAFLRTETADTINNKIDEVVNDAEMYEEGEERPEGSVIREVKELVEKTKKFHVAGRRFPEVIVRPLDGKLRLTWQTPRASVTLVYSREPSGRYIYREAINGWRVTDSGITSDVSPLSLADHLKQLISE